ncbi:hypothetical protein RGQ21_02430 [Kitasatospora aureofaciens]|nr:hypothetical protein RGQ21_02430 [Kitasatospora aureofaciens]
MEGSAGAVGGTDTVDCSESGMRVRAPVRAEAVAMTAGGGTEARQRAKGGDSGGRATPSTRAGRAAGTGGSPG